MSHLIATVTITYEDDVVVARQRARQVAALLGFDPQDQTKIGTAVSEIARNAFRYAGGGLVEFFLEGQTRPQSLLIKVSDRGPGIADLQQILDGRYRSTTGMGMGLIGARRLMDRCEVHTESGKGTIVCLRKGLGPRAPLWTAADIRRAGEQLARQPVQSIQEELRLRNHELLRTLEELRARQEELLRVNQELEDTNRGVVALYAELDERADHLRRADQMKSHFLSNMSHEFRTPLNSILALSGLLLERADGDLNDEQEKQVRFIRKGAETLLELVNDLLDLAKIEAGKLEVKPVDFDLKGMFSALRGMLKPLLVSSSLTLTFEEPADMPTLFTDEGKVSQIVRNFLSNALKFTERGEIRVTAAAGPGPDELTIAVADTGIGIKPEDQEHIFREFTQLDNPVQRRVKGTGLGLPLCRKLAVLLGGTVTLESQVGRGSTFRVTIPMRYQGVEEKAHERTLDRIDNVEPGRTPILLIEDDLRARHLYEQLLQGSSYHLIAASGLRQADWIVQTRQPAAIVLDMLLRGEDAWQWLARMKAEDRTRHIPILVATTVEDREKGLSLGADGYCAKPLEAGRLQGELARVIEAAMDRARDRPVLLIVDDDAVFRYRFLRQTTDLSYHVAEAVDGIEGLRLARELCPAMIWLDLNMPGLSGWEVIQQLATSPETAEIPIVVVTSQDLTSAERAALGPAVRAVIKKDETAEEAMRRILTDTAPEIRLRPRTSGASLDT